MAPEARALFITPIAPALSGNGLAMRQGIFYDALRQVARLDTLVVPIWGTAPDARAIERFGQIRSVPVGRGDTQLELIRHIADPEARLQRFRDYGRGSRHALLSAPVLADIGRRCARERYDLVHVARLYLAETREVVGGAVATLDLDEDDAWAWRLKAQTEDKDAAAWSNAEADAEDRLLARLGGRFEVLFAAGPEDQVSLRARHPSLPIETIPNAISFPAAPVRRDDGHTLVFVGGLGYAPNREGLQWFAGNVWPLSRSKDRLLRLRVVGAFTGTESAGLADIAGIELLGPVEDLASIYASATLAIAPLHAGSGTRIKVIEAAAHGVPVVATSIATRGLGFAKLEHIWIADTPEAFAAAIRDAIDRPTERRRRAGIAYTAARAVHDRVDVVSQLASRFAAVLAGDPLQRGA